MASTRKSRPVVARLVSSSPRTFGDRPACILLVVRTRSPQRASHKTCRKAWDEKNVYLGQRRLGYATGMRSRIDSAERNALLLLPELDDPVDGRALNAERAVGQGHGQRVGERKDGLAWSVHSRRRVQL